LKEREHSEDIGVNGKLIFKIYKLGCDVVERILLAQDVGKAAGCFECGDELPGHTKWGEFLENLRTFDLSGSNVLLGVSCLVWTVLLTDRQTDRQTDSFAAVVWCPELCAIPIQFRSPPQLSLHSLSRL
jgi:hypothetical protein